MNMSMKDEILKDLQKKKADLEEKLKPLREMEEDYSTVCALIREMTEYRGPERGGPGDR
jgi:flagellar motility protein MotE (MotC chaperone)